MNAAKNNEKWVETLLSAHPAEVSDDGFSKKVIADIQLQERKRLFILAPFFIGAFGLLLGFFPYDLFDGLTGSVSTTYQTYLPYLVPVGAVITMFMFSWFSEEAA